VINAVMSRLGFVPHQDVEKTRRQLELAVKDRDSARREICRMVEAHARDGQGLPVSAMDYAARRSWNCFPGPANEHVPMCCSWCGEYMGRITRRQACWTCERELSGH
jgi:hypothetical protein